MKRMISALSILALAVLACSCQSGPTTGGAEYPATPSAVPTAQSATPLPVPTATAVEQKRSVVLVALDGARQDWIARYIAEGTMPNLAALSQRGVVAPAGLQPVEPVLPAPGYLALSTGTFANRTGLAPTGLQQLSGALAQFVNLLDEGATAAEPFWRTAMRNGLRTATVFWPGAAPDAPGIRADYMVTAAESDIPAAQHTISLQEAGDWADVPASFSPLQEGVLRVVSAEGSTVATWHVLALDGQDDAKTAYDRLVLDTDKDLANGHTELPLGEWAAVSVSPRLHSAARLCFTASAGLTVTLYQSRPAFSQAHPGDLLRTLNERLGPPPPAPDSAALRAGWLSPQQYSAMAERRAEWMGYVALYVYRTYAPDLLLAAQSVIADYAVPFSLVDGRQEGYSPEKAELYGSLLSGAHALADEYLENLLEAVDLARSAFFVVSPYGLAPVHTMVNVNTILSNAKLLQVKSGAGLVQVDTGKSKAWAAAAEGNVHIYINLQGREWPGVVAPEDYAGVQQQIIAALQGTVDETGQAVFARVLGVEELGALHMGSPDVGDVFAQAAPGYYLSDELGVKKVLGIPPCRAAAGLEATTPEMQGVFIAAGDGLLSGKTMGPVSILDIAPTIAQALRFQPAAAVQGQPIAGIWR